MSSSQVDFSRFVIRHIEEGYEEEDKFSSGSVEVTDTEHGTSVLMTYSNFSDVYFGVDVEEVLGYAFRARRDYLNGNWDSDYELDVIKDLNFALEVLLKDELDVYAEHYN